MGKEIAFNRRISQKGQHGSLKLHRISENFIRGYFNRFGKVAWSANLYKSK